MTYLQNCRIWRYDVICFFDIYWFKSNFWYFKKLCYFSFHRSFLKSSDMSTLWTSHHFFPQKLYFVSYTDWWPILSHLFNYLCVTTNYCAKNIKNLILRKVAKLTFFVPIQTPVIQEVGMIKISWNTSQLLAKCMEMSCVQMLFWFCGCAIYWWLCIGATVFNL